MSSNTQASPVIAVPLPLVGWSAALGLLLLGLIGTDYYTGLRVLQESITTTQNIFHAVLLLIAFGLLSSCAFLRRLQFASKLLQASLVAATLVFLVLTGSFLVAFVASEVGSHSGLWRFFVPVIAVQAILTAWPWFLWRRLRQLRTPFPLADAT